jgi:hypothetical protein
MVNTHCIYMYNNTTHYIHLLYNTYTYVLYNEQHSALLVLLLLLPVATTAAASVSVRTMLLQVELLLRYSKYSERMIPCLIAKCMFERTSCTHT